MKTLLTLAISATTFISGCTLSTAQRKDASPTPERANSNVVRTNSPPTPNNGVSPPAANGQPGRPTRNLRGRERVDIDPSATPLPLSFEKAAENSQFALSMDNSGAVVETRVFEKHPQLKKAELKWSDAKIKVLKLYLADGKTKEGKTDKLSSIRTISSAELLALAGIRPKAPAASSTVASPKR